MPTTVALIILFALSSLVVLIILLYHYNYCLLHKINFHVYTLQVQTREIVAAMHVHRGIA